MEERSNVIPFPNRHLERINGVQVDLGRASLSELVAMEEEAERRMVEAATDMGLVQAYRQERFPGGPGDAA